MNNMKRTSLVLSLASLMTLQTLTTTAQARNENGAAIVGAIIGGVVGHQIGDGRGRTAATIIGVVAGAAIGAKVGRDMDENDRRYHSDAQRQAFERNDFNRPYTWRGERSGCHGSVTSLREGYNYRTQETCREYRSEIRSRRETEITTGYACRRNDGSWYEVRSEEVRYGNRTTTTTTVTSGGPGYVTPHNPPPPPIREERRPNPPRIEDERDVTPVFNDRDRWNDEDDRYDRDDRDERSEARCQYDARYYSQRANEDLERSRPYVSSRDKRQAANYVTDSCKYDAFRALVDSGMQEDAPYDLATRVDRPSHARTFKIIAQKGYKSPGKYQAALNVKSSAAFRSIDKLLERSYREDSYYLTVSTLTNRYQYEAVTCLANYEITSNYKFEVIGNVRSQCAVNEICRMAQYRVTDNESYRRASYCARY